jgi:hypothetical protein
VRESAEGGERMILRWLALLASLVFVVSCGPSNDKPTTPSADGSMDDALALLPGNAIAVGTVDARAFFGSQTFGADIAKLAEKYIPIGPEAGFQASRDVDRVTWASYSYQGVDIAAVVIGKFDEAKIKQAAASHTSLKGGNTIVASQYAGRDVYTVANVGFTLLSPERAIAGTESGIRRVLERIKDKRVKRDITPWMIQTVETQGAAATAAIDLATQAMPAEVARQIPMPFMQNLKAVRAVATFDQGIQIAGSLTYPDEAGAQAALPSIKQAQSFSKILAVLGINVKKFDVATEKADVQVKLAFDDASLRQVAASLPSWLGQPPQ